MNGNIYNSSPFGNLSQLTLRGNSSNEFAVYDNANTLIFNIDTITPLITANSNVTINGTLSYTNIDILTTTDPEIKLADGNLTNNLDIGIYGEYSTDGKTPTYTGIYKDHTSGYWTIYDSLLTEPTTTVPGSYTLSNFRGNNSLFSRNFIGDGSLSNPALAFNNETSTGIFRSAAGNLDFSITGNQILKLTTSGLSTTNILPTADTTYNLGSGALRFGTIYSANLSGNIITGSQSGITSLGGLTSIQGTTITPGQWSSVANMQDVATDSKVTFSTVTATTFTGNLVGNASGTSLTVTAAAQPAITTLLNLSSVAGSSINSTKWGYLSALDQSLTTGSNVTFYSVTASLGFDGPLTGNVTGNLTGSVLTPSQTAITSVGTLTSLTMGGNINMQNSNSITNVSSITGGGSCIFGNITASTGDMKVTSGNLVIGSNTITPTIAAYLAGINQSLSTSASPTFVGLTTSATNTINFAGEALKVIGSSSQAYASFYNAASRRGYIGTGSGGSNFIVNADQILQFQAGNTAAAQINTSGNMTIGTSDLASTNYKLYVDGSQYNSANHTVIGLGGFGAGYRADARVNIAGSLTSAGASVFGICSTAKLGQSSGSGNAFHNYIYPDCSNNSGTILNSFGLYVDAGASTGTINTAVGIYAEQPTYGTTKWALYANGNMKLGSGYRYLEMNGGNSTGYLFTDFNYSADGINFAYNFRTNNSGTGVIPNTAGATSNIKCGYGEILLQTAGTNTAPITRMTISVNGATTVTGVTTGDILKVLTGSNSNNGGIGLGRATVTECVMATCSSGGQYFGSTGTGDTVIRNENVSTGQVFLGGVSNNGVFVDPSGHWCPGGNNTQQLGKSSQRWSEIYCVNPVINTSDATEKKNIQPSNLGLDFVTRTHPVKFEYKEGKRPHHGFIAQEVKEVLDDLNVDSGMYIDPSVNDENDDNPKGLRYCEMIGPLYKAIQEMKAIIDAQNIRITQLESNQ